MKNEFVSIFGAPKTKPLEMNINKNKNLALIVLPALLILSCSNPESSDKSSASVEPSVKQTSGLKPHFGGSESNYYLADTIAGHIHQPNFQKEFKWPEHPKGIMIQKTNNMGFKKDTDTKIEKIANTFRVLVTGDSHIDGVVYNSESYPNQLEELVNKNASDSLRYEFINAGAGYYGPQNYFGALKRFKELKPDMFIVTIYTGNDFLDAVRIENENGRLQVPERKDDYYYDLWAVDEKYSGFTGQLMNQVKFFKKFPEFKITTISITQNYLTLIKEYCVENNIQLFIVLLPTKVDVEPKKDEARIKEVQEILKFTIEDIKINQALTQEMIKWLKANNLNYVDLHENWKENSIDEELFWKADYHLNHNGHRRIAEIIQPLISKP